jgi:hypothetical protein
MTSHYTKNFDQLKSGNFGKMNAKYTFKTLLESKKEFEDCLLDCSYNFDSNQGKLEQIMNYLSNRIIDFGIDGCFENRTICYENQRINLFVPVEQQESILKLQRQYSHLNREATLRKMSEYMNINDFFYKEN